MGMEVKIDLESILEDVAKQAKAEIEPQVQKAMWESTQKMAEKLTTLLRDKLREIYTNLPKSKYYDRTYEFAGSVYVKPTQGHGSYGLSIRWIGEGEEGGIQVHLAPRTKNGKRGRKFNAHASFEDKDTGEVDPISIEQLLSIEDERKNINTVLANIMETYLNTQGWDMHLSLVNYDQFDFGMFL